MNYEEDITIDPDGLDVEWLRQATLMMRYAQLSAKARRTLDLAKERLELVKAQLDSEIRTNPEKYGLTKVTEGAVASTIITHDKYKDASDALIEAQFQVNITFGVVKAIDGKKEALENLVKLNGQQYFAGPKSPRDLSLEAQKAERQKDANAKVGEAMKRRRES